MNDYGKVIFDYADIKQESFSSSIATLFFGVLGMRADQVDKQSSVKVLLEACSKGCLRYTSSYGKKSLTPNYCKYEALFWIFMVLAVDKDNESEKISAICDLIALVNVNEDEVNDLLHVVKLMFREVDENYQFKTETVPEELSSIIEYYQ